ncbi:MAG: hypothetical protein LBL04_16050, partial [Bacteroidales bacterium]|nr:hypothetical protein [Bacteroidales bacterium]
MPTDANRMDVFSRKSCRNLFLKSLTYCRITNPAVFRAAIQLPLNGCSFRSFYIFRPHPERAG